MWLPFNAKSVIFQLFHGENNDDVCVVLDQHAYLDFYSASYLINYPRVDMSLHLDTSSWFRAIQVWPFSLLLRA